MLLRVKSRILLLNVLPAMGGFDTLRIVRELQSALSFSEEEHKKLDFKQIGEMTRWKEEDASVDVPMGEKAADVIKDALRELDSRKKLSADLMPLYEHFVLGEDWKED